MLPSTGTQLEEVGGVRGALICRRSGCFSLLVFSPNLAARLFHMISLLSALRLSGVSNSSVVFVLVIIPADVSHLVRVYVGLFRLPPAGRATWLMSVYLMLNWLWILGFEWFVAGSWPLL